MVAKHLDKFAAPFQQSHIPFVLAEVVTNGRGEMVDLICRFANGAAERMLDSSVKTLRNLRFTAQFPSGDLEALRPLEKVAFSGSSASFSIDTPLGRTLRITCYQPMYGLAACILDTAGSVGTQAEAIPTQWLPAPAAVLELSRGGVRCAACNRHFCALTGWSRQDLLAPRSAARLADPEDWPEVLQALLDAAREGRSTAHTFRLQRRGASSLWVELRAELLYTREGISTFYGLFLDIDQQHRAQAELTQAQAELDHAQKQLSGLFDDLLGGCCILRQTADAPPVPVQLGQKLADLLGYSRSELLRHISSDLMWCVYPADREELSAAAARARACALPLRHVCRLRLKGGGCVWTALEMTRRAEQSGSTLLYVTCSDVTSLKEMDTQLLFRRQLCELLLDRSELLLLDYDPASDTARMERWSQDGHRAAWSSTDYLASLQESSFIHPEDRKRVASAIKRAITRPSPEQLEYRGNYDDQGWRWYQVVWLRQVDDQGNISRLLGKAVDITAQKAAQEQFLQLKNQYKKLPDGTIALVRLDLSEDRILDAKGASRRISRILFGNTADACLRHLRDRVPEEAQRLVFDSRFRKDALLEAFHRGQTFLSMQHRFLADAPLRVETALRLMADPANGHINAFCAIRATQPDHPSTAVLEKLAQRYEAVVSVDADTGLCQLWGAALPAQTTYRALAARYLHSQPPSPQRAALRRAARLETVLAHLEKQESYVLSCPSQTIRWCSLDQERSILLMTLENT